MKELARGTLVAGPLRDHANLEEAVEMATFNLEVRIGERRRELMAENEAFVATRRQSFAQVHERRLRSLRLTLATHRNEATRERSR